MHVQPDQLQWIVLRNKRRSIYGKQAIEESLFSESFQFQGTRTHKEKKPVTPHSRSSTPEDGRGLSSPPLEK